MVGGSKGLAAAHREATNREREWGPLDPAFDEGETGARRRVRVGGRLPLLTRRQYGDDRVHDDALVVHGEVGGRALILSSQSRRARLLVWAVRSRLALRVGQGGGECRGAVAMVTSHPTRQPLPPRTPRATEHRQVFHNSNKGPPLPPYQVIESNLRRELNSCTVRGKVVSVSLRSYENMDSTDIDQNKLLFSRWFSIEPNFKSDTSSWNRIQCLINLRRQCLSYNSLFSRHLGFIIAQWIYIVTIQKL